MKVKNEVNAVNIIKFIVCTLLGITLVLIPFSFGGRVDTILFYYLKMFISEFNSQLTLIVTILLVLSSLLAVVDSIFKPTFIREHELMKNLFSTTPFYVVNRICGAVVAVLCYLNIGPEFIISMDTGSAMLDLATQLSLLVPSMLLFQTFILEFGAMEFIGELLGFIIKPIFKVSEICAVSIISAWVGPGNAAILGTQELFKNGYYTVKEAAVIGSQFSTSSIGWVVLVCSIFGLMDNFGLIFLGLTIIGIIIAFISVRIPPISKYPDTYADGSNERIDSGVETSNSTSKGKRALEKACQRSASVTIKNFTSKKNNMLFYVLWLTPIIVFWGTAALAISIHTPILQWISLPVQWILELFNIPQAALTASAIMSGFADNYLPVILGGAVLSVESRVIIAMMSILQLVFMSEIATLLKSTNVVPNFKDIILVFIERTLIALPFVIIFVKIFF